LIKLKEIDISNKLMS